MDKNLLGWRFWVSLILIVIAFAAGFSTALAKYQLAQSAAADAFSQKPSVGTASADGENPSVRIGEKSLNRLQGIGDHPDSEVKYDVILEVLMKWASVDPEAALNYVRDHYDPRHRSAFLSSLLGMWSEKDGRAALDWTTKNLPHDYTHYDAVLSTIGKTDPEAAWRYAGELAAKEEPQNVPAIYVSALRGIVYAGNYKQAAGFIANVQMLGGDKSDLSGILAGQWGLYDPDQAAQWVATLPTDSGINLYRRQALVSLGVSWAQSDPLAAANFAIQLPPGVARQNMLATSLDSWATEHPDEAAQWLNQSSANPDLKFVVRSLATSPKMIDSDPSEAITWANTIQDDEPVRLQTLTLIMNRWIANDSVAAQKYLDNSNDLSPEMLAKLKKNLNLNSDN
jgi:hypothetical protein